jgi:hypothetical protein
VVQVEERERGISGEDVKWMQFSPWKGLVKARDGINVIGK